MFPAPKLSNEDLRLEALRSYRILDTEPEECFDNFTHLAAQICGSAISLISLVDAERQWFKSKVGLDSNETPRDLAFCAHAILEPEELMVVRDATKDERFGDNPLVTGKPEIRFYAGAPLMNGEGFPLGTLCVIDREPRDLAEDQKEALTILGRCVVSQLEQRRISFSLANALENIQIMKGMLPICSHCRKVRDDHGYWSRVEEYVRSHSDAEFSHGICPDCLRKEFPEVADSLEESANEEIS